METTTNEKLLMQAMDHLHANRLEQAQTVCEQVLALEPENGECLFLLGSIALRAGNIPQACECYLQAASTDPDSLIGKLAMGFYLRQAGKLSEAIACFRQATVVAPNDPTAWVLLGEMLNGQGRTAEARECSKRLKQINTSAMKPQITPTKRFSTGKSAARQETIKPLKLDELLYVAHTLYKQARIPEALGSYRQAIALHPDSAQALYGIGSCLLRLNQVDEAISYLKQALALTPTQTEAMHHLVLSLIKKADYKQAETYARQLVQLEPRSASGQVDLALTLHNQYRLREAAACYHRAMELDPKEPWIYNNLGTTMRYLGEIEEAILCYQKALELRPDFADARANLGMLLLLQGNFEQGWKYREARLQTPDFAPLRASCPPWDGGTLTDKTILIRAEQGMGDAIQFARYLPMLKARGARIKFMGPHGLKSLFASLDCIEEWLDMEQDEVTGVDAYSPLLSLPGIFGTRLETIPTKVPYLMPNAECRQRWQERLASYEGYKVGIVWAGNPAFPRDQERSCALNAFLPLMAVPGVSLFSLQKGERATAQLTMLPADKHVIDLADQLHTFDDTAAAILNLDLVISVDTSVAHLAGALGHPVWTLLPYANDWRWLLHREDSPWYPTMRLFRQPALLDWDAVFRNVAAALAAESQRKQKS